VKTWIPSVPEVARETLIVLAGAVLAAAIVGRLPGLKAWISQQWGKS
jgi:hypothetical protein